MKLASICLAGICLIVVASGCNKPDPRIAKYEQRITALESNVTELYVRNENRKTMENSLLDLQTNTHAAISSMTDSNGILTILSSQFLQHEFQIGILEAQMTNLWSLQAAKFQPRTVPQNTYRPVQPGVMPAAIAAQIRAAAEREWPNNYTMQVYEIKRQSEAWQKLHQ